MEGARRCAAARAAEVVRARSARGKVRKQGHSVATRPWHISIRARVEPNSEHRRAALPSSPPAMSSASLAAGQLMSAAAAFVPDMSVLVSVSFSDPTGRRPSVDAGPAETALRASRFASVATLSAPFQPAPLCLPSRCCRCRLALAPGLLSERGGAAPSATGGLVSTFRLSPLPHPPRARPPALSAGRQGRRQLGQGPHGRGALL